MKVWLVAIAFLVCACTSNADVSAGSDSSGIADIEVQLVEHSDDSDLEARIEALEARISYLEGYKENMVSPALKELAEYLNAEDLNAEESTGATTNAITMDDLYDCIYDLLPLIKDAFNSLEVEHQSSVLQHHPGHKVGAWGTLGLIPMPSGCR
jgi:ABC-type phosphate/phosphonate transport system substrate-binding protein